jgi:rhamnulokinase
MEHIAVDIGASSGRVLSGKIIRDNNSESKIQLDEIYRFENNMFSKNNHFFWDIDGLFNNIIKGLQEAKKIGIDHCTLGIDTWGVDYVIVDEAGIRIRDVYTYRDDRTATAIEDFQKIIPKEIMYRKTGIQFMQFNTIFQLFTDDKNELNKTYKILFIPDYLYFLLSGKYINEKTIASTGELLNLETMDFDDDLLKAAGLKRDQFAELVSPGTRLGKIKDELCTKYNLPDCELIISASHDTASAVLGVPYINEKTAYLSSGTWSLMGLEKKMPVNNKLALECNYTNEWGAYDTYRFLKNCTGLWMIQEIRRNCDCKYNFEELAEEAKKGESFKYYLNCNDKCFLKPDNMIDEIKKFCSRTGQSIPESIADITRAVFDSLALSYRQNLEEIEKITGDSIDLLNIVGGGVKNKFLCQTTSNVLERPVMAGPVESTALGNIAVQMISSGELNNIEEVRNLIKRSFPSYEYKPVKIDGINNIYNKFKNIIRAV